jgi:hypothetical protein
VQVACGRGSEADAVHDVEACAPRRDGVCIGRLGCGWR